MKTADKIKVQIESQQNEAAGLAIELYNLDQKRTVLENKMREIKGALDVLNVMRSNEDENDSKG